MFDMLASPIAIYAGFGVVIICLCLLFAAALGHCSRGDAGRIRRLNIAEGSLDRATKELIIKRADDRINHYSERGE